MASADGKKIKFRVGQWVHVNSDNEDWGRIAEDAVIIKIRKDGLILVALHDTRTNIFVIHEEVTPIQ